MQYGLPATLHHSRMAAEDLTPAQLIAWAKEHSGKTWTQLGAEVGCTHAALIQWARGQTDVLAARVALVVAYARATGCNLHWLLTGDGPRLVPGNRTEHQLVSEARHIVAERPALAEGAYQMLLAFERVSAPSKT